MWETTRLPPESIEQLNHAQAVVVPSRWCADIFSANGVSVPLFVVPPGVDREEFNNGVMPTASVCRFGTAGRLAHGGPRKGIETVIAAFQAAFPHENDVRLTVKIWPDCDICHIHDPRITLVRDPLTTEQLRDWFHSLTVYVTASCGEGFGLLPLQAMACGRAVIATQFSGHSEYFDATVGYPLRYRYQPAGGIYTGLGHWGVPDFESIVQQMRAVYHDRARLMVLSANAAARAHQYSWRRTALGLLEVFQALGALESTLLSPRASFTESLP
jgi:glycosyltransferase involved in cell wall biosynthesis